MALIVGSWPGNYPHNSYITRFRESLELAGVTTKDVVHPFFSIFSEIDVLHIHSPEAVFWGSGRFKASSLAILALTGIWLLKVRGVKIVWCVHDLEPHGGGSELFRRLWQIYVAGLVILIDGFVTLSPSTVQIAREAIPGLAKKPATFIWHPEYNVEKRLTFDRFAWRCCNNIPASSRIVALIGQLRRYKGVEELLECFGRTDDSSLRLLIAGGPENEEYLRFLQASAARDKRIVLKLGALSEDEFSSAALAADLIALPYRKIFHSGSIIYGLSCRRPVLTPATPYAQDILAQTGPLWMKVYKGPLMPSHFKHFTVPEDQRLDLEFLSIRESGLKIKAFYLAL